MKPRSHDQELPNAAFAKNKTRLLWDETPARPFHPTCCFLEVQNSWTWPWEANISLDSLRRGFLIQHAIEMLHTLKKRG